MTSKAAIERERAAVRRRIAELDQLFDDIAASIDTANTDDEHDPEGTTLGFERAKIVSLREDARGRLEALDDAAFRVDARTYGVCERCGGDIGAERLAALPGSRHCIACARLGVDTR